MGVDRALIAEVVDADLYVINMLNSSRQDYHRSQAYGLSEEGKAHIKKHLPELDADKWGSAPKQTILDLLAEIDRRFGSVPQYLASIGFDAAHQEQLRRVLRK